MQFRNLTPFSALSYAALDPADDEHRVIAMKVGYRLVRNGDAWRAVVLDDEPMALCMADEFFGEPGDSSTRQESDLAPCKPRCDVLVNATAQAPGGRPARHWRIGVRVSTSAPPAVAEPERPQPLNPFMGLTQAQIEEWEQARDRQGRRAGVRATRTVLLEKWLSVHGPSEFRKLGWLPWRRTRVRPAVKVPVRWEQAFGGHSVVRDPRTAEAPPWLDEVCFANPLGCGWIEKRWMPLARRAGAALRKSLPAPQIDYPGHTLKQPVRASHPQHPLNAKDMQRIAANYGHPSAGLGAIGRAWAPRLAKAGTYDQAWLESRHPGLPQDFDYGYWNAAPADQQISYLPPDACIELWHLTPSELTPNGHLSVGLPGHRPFVLMRLSNGAMLPLPMVTDTVLIDTEAMTLALTHRTWIPADTPVRVAEARFETDPRAPLLRLAEPLFQEDR